MPTILSTKKITKSQQQQLLSAGLNWIDEDFITTEILDFESNAKVENAIFTSKNGVNAVLEKGIAIKNAFCVGMRTKALLEENRVEVIKAGKNGEALGEILVNEFQQLEFTYFCAKDRLDILPSKLRNNEIDFKEIAVYQTVLCPKKINDSFDGVLFFSPSGVESFFQENELQGQAFCIGNTTANAVKKYTTNYTVASKTTVENVLVTAINYFTRQ